MTAELVLLDGGGALEGAVRRPGAPSLNPGFGAEGAVRRPGAPSLNPEIRAELRALAAGRGPPAYLPELVEALSCGGAASARGGRSRYGFVVARDRAGIAAAAAVVITTDVLFDALAGDGWLRRLGDLVRRHPRRLGARTLCVGTPLAQEGGLLVRPGLELHAAVESIERGLREAAAALGCHAVLWKDVAGADPLRGLLRARGYGEIATLPAATVDLAPHGDLHGYLEWIRAVASYGDLRRKMRDGGYDSPGLREHLRRRGGEAALRAHFDRAAVRFARLRERWPEAPPAGAGGLRLETCAALPPALLPEVHALYLAQSEAARFRWEVLDERFFRRVAALPEARFTLAWLGGALAGFSASLVLGGRLVTLRAGARPGAARALSLPVLLVLRDIEAALALGCREILLGPTGYALKARFGAAFTPTVSLLRVLSPLAALSRPLAAAIDLENRRAGVADLHRIDFRSAFTPRPHAAGAPPPHGPPPHGPPRPRTDAPPAGRAPPPPTVTP